jgi:hypothetical protein
LWTKTLNLRIKVCFKQSKSHTYCQGFFKGNTPIWKSWFSRVFTYFLLKFLCWKRNGPIKLYCISLYQIGWGQTLHCGCKECPINYVLSHQILYSFNFYLPCKCMK